MPQVIGLAGLAGAGKSTAAGILVSQGWKLVKFADPLKDMLRAIGLTQAEIEGEKKGLSSRLLGGKSPRYAMQTLGTDWGRVLISEDFWVNIWKQRARQQLLDGFCVVADDCRFANEVLAIKDFGGEVWTIHRPGLKAGSHPSESGSAMRFSSQMIRNDGTPDDLLAKVMERIG